MPMRRRGNAAGEMAVLSEVPDVELRWDEPLSRHTTFGIGGPVACLARPRSEEAFVRLLRMVRRQGLRYFLLGGGSNILAPDEPWDAVAIQPIPAFSTVKCLDSWESDTGESVLLYAGAGVRMGEWLRFCLHRDLGGMEALVGIPGTVGGALVMNAGTKEGCMADLLVSMDVIDDEGRLRRLPRSELTPEYRSMGLPREWAVVGGGFALRKSSAEKSRARMIRLMAKRKRTQPMGRPSAGCVFKNPPGDSAGRLIDRSGLKGLRLGGAQISEKHGNWILNQGGATAGDVIGLMERMEERVLGEFGIRLERELKVLKT